MPQPHMVVELAMGLWLTDISGLSGCTNSFDHAARFWTLEDAMAAVHEWDQAGDFEDSIMVRDMDDRRWTPTIDDRVTGEEYVAMEARALAAEDERDRWKATALTLQTEVVRMDGHIKVQAARLSSLAELLPSAREKGDQSAIGNVPGVSPRVRVYCQGEED